MFDRNWEPIPNGFDYKRVTTAAREAGQNGPHERLAFDGLNQIVVKEAGYIYIYVSNESDAPVDVFFDDFKVEHVKSPVIAFRVTILLGWHTIVGHVKIPKAGLSIQRQGNAR